ncbi:low molecular weight phosphatase family protein [Mycolicibacterium rhodesiae]|uniref:Low molecular weight phosphatase family protein n=1 Tax=Mycolicibacterium rhodesiae TaxID=36814 RepID=A0A1X0J1E0_MYCRH|nr:low molecular weight phosphatase family protein [Mycolicibacterium rhodesiae]MCV7345434.1 low molecular weight phosphatase family protein [Mycolicibacterium rhodesiae]ORB55043.1 low molecular weight phosphatase family protein [Mycolicibacterium rhodesiae]
MHILFVCTGNICRSPMAERLALVLGSQLRIGALTTSSAGTRAVIGSPIHPEAARILEHLGGTASDFAARQLTPRIVGDADLIITMTRAHRDAVLGLAPRQLHRTFTLSEAALLVSERNAQTVADLAALRPQLPSAAAADIPDPIGQDSEFFARVGTQIAELLPPILTLCKSD